MIGPGREEINQGTRQSRELAPHISHIPCIEIAQRRPSTFLSLAPNMSDSYPRTQRAQQPLTAEALASVAKQDGEDNADALKRRTSSLSSDASKSRLRFLKLGPVHWGEHQDDHKDDFHEVAVE
ncbi:hypothetical protein N656DRAFT_790167 [Canariomyces notabilis]|uniref:Uncharacterized protein n=1 Tax=Canariomyces notabilis TaxID=2074819 RepID=A0AAN6TCT6_9PEZI|nr:hypothetical protein N656DRAFT_790167 [Canariomyces arenarius]